MLPTALAWLDSEGAKLDAPTRSRLLALFRPLGWLPGWLRGHWARLVARFVRLPLIILAEGDRSSVHDLLLSHGCVGVHDLPALGCVCGRVPVGALSELCRAPGVTRVWFDSVVRALPRCQPEQIESRLKGWGVTIAVLDTGISPHPDVGGRVIAFADLVGSRSSPYDDHGHGTVVAGCAAWTAPGALLVGLKVLNRAGAGPVSALLRGIDWVIGQQDRYRIRVLCIGTACDLDPLAEGVRKARLAGLCVVHCGNDAGAAALLLEAQPELTPEDVEARLMPPDLQENG